MFNGIYSEIYRNELWMHSTTWINLQNIMRCNSREIQKTTYSIIPLMKFQKDKSNLTESKSVVVWG